MIKKDFFGSFPRFSALPIAYAKLKETLGDQSVFLCKITTSYFVSSVYVVSIQVSLVHLLLEPKAGWGGM